MRMSKIRKESKDHPTMRPLLYIDMDGVLVDFDIYILSTAPWNNPSAWADKLNWVKQYLGDRFKKRVILCHHKNFLKGDFLVDDREKNGAKDFSGEWIHFGSNVFPNWEAVVNYLKKV